MRMLIELLSNLPTGATAVDMASGEILYANREAVRIIRLDDTFKWANMEHVTEYIDIEGNVLDIEELPTTLVRKTKQPVERTTGLRYYDGSVVWLNTRSVVMTVSTGEEVVVTTFLDISSIILAAQEQRRIYQEEQEFIANVSHEMRTPLNLVLGYSEMLLLLELPADVLNAINIIHRRARDMRWLVDNILTIFKVEDGQGEKHFSPVDLAEVLHDCVDSMQIMAKKNSVELTIRVDQPQVTVLANSVELTLLFNNLVQNAIKFAPNGRVHVTMGTQESEAVVTIHDSGIGMSVEDMENIWRRFWQVDGSDTRKFGGTGIGLYVVAMLVKRHNGRIVVESEVGESSTFRVYLPLQHTLQEGGEVQP